ncbi:hypothetical protein AX15_002414 [Amanita polypyramis BW_CC]|nr:hypothetical protein AX15_002414 [Amanita polypyramis BW_CC]
MDTTLLGSRPSSTSLLLDSLSTSDTSLDQVSSLRAAALSTLRAKRRKPGMEKVSLSRPPPPVSIQLDYGQEDQTSQNPSHLSTKPPSTVPATNVVQSTDDDTKHYDEDLQMREEGEISEEEEVPPPAPQAPKEMHKSPVEERKSPVKSSPPVRPYSTVQQVSAHSPVQSRRVPEASPLSSLHESATPSGHHIRLSAAQLALLSLDASHVRPGLQMTQQQYDTAKDIILDLLGWGVPPEYLIECGLSREIVFYVFVELNLRLPQNFDTTGLIPYTPESVALARQAASLPVQQDVHSPGTLSPRSPGVKIGNGVAISLKPSEVPSMPVSIETSISPTSLHDMEMQRKQELLARKRAVIASRKLRQSSSSTNAATTSQVGSTPVTPDDPTSAVTADVDDFLKSISAPDGLDASANTSSSFHPQSDDAMDVDDIPGLGGLLPAQSNLDPSHQTSTSRSTPSSKNETPIALSPTGLPQSFVESSRPVEKKESVSSVGSSASLTRERSYGSVHGEQSRRGTKRPVASDFVDFDTNARHPTMNGNAHLYPFVRRKVVAVDFGAVSNGNRRCVIDLSDSEEETEDMLRLRSEPEGDGVEGGTVPTPSSSSTPPVIGSPSAAPGGIKKPSKLELEIQRMKEWIAMKEKERQRKLASKTQSAPESTVVDNILKIEHEEANHSLRPKSPLPSDYAGANNNGPTVMKDGVTNLNEPSGESTQSSAAALAGASDSCTRRTPAIDDNPSATNDQDNITEGQVIGAESAEDVVMRSVVDESVGHVEHEQASELVDVDVDMSSSAQVRLPSSLRLLSRMRLG